MMKIKIAIAMHAHSSIDFDVHFNHLNVIRQWGGKHETILLGYKGLMAAEAREMLCNNAIEQKCSHIFFLDADHLIPEKTLDFLVETADQAIVSGLVCRKFYPFGQVVWGKDDKKETYLAADLDLSGDIVEVGVCAFGCTLINIKKLQDLERPWFRDTCNAKSDGKLANIRSDVNICDAFRANNEKVWIDTRILVGHVGTSFIVMPQNAGYLKHLKHHYTDSFKPKYDQQGLHATLPRLL